MSTFIIKNPSVQMPTSFVEIDREEMEYIDGGVSWKEARAAILAVIGSAVVGLVGKGVSQSWIAGAVTRVVTGWVASAIDTATIVLMYSWDFVTKHVAAIALGVAVTAAAYMVYLDGKYRGKW